MTQPPDAGTTDLPGGEPAGPSALPPAPDPTADAGSPAPPAATTTAPTAAPPRRLRAFLIGLVLAAVLAVFLFVGLGVTSTSGKDAGTGGVVPVGSTAPDFTLPSVPGAAPAPVNLYGLGKHRHHPVILNFFASWCVPCRTETPLLASTARAEQAKGSVLQFVGVDGNDLPSDAIPFIHQSGITYPVGQDATLRVTADTYGLIAEPNTFFIDESGTVVGHVQGPVSKGELDRWIHTLVGGR